MSATSVDVQARGSFHPESELCYNSSMTWKLFLDDIRPPPDGSWTVARSVRAAWHHITEYGLPIEMSLDHDLGEGHDADAPVLLHAMINGYLDGDVQFLNVKLIKFNVHSANPQGVENLQGLWASFLRSAP